MDFSLIEKHPWITTGIVIGGGVILFLTLRGSGGQSAGGGGTSYVGVDPATANAQAAADVANTQAQTYLAGLQLQGATQISLAQIGAGVSTYGTGRTADTIDTQTAAQLALGLGSQNVQVQISQMQTNLQMRYLDAIIAALGGSPGVTTSTPNSPSPTTTITPAYPVSVAPTPIGTGGGSPTYLGSVNPGSVPPGSSSWYCPPGHNCDPVTGFDLTQRLNGLPQNPRLPAALPGGTQLVPTPGYATCDPRDVACVMGNQTLNVGWENNSISANNTNNFNQCLINAEMSRGFGNYDSLVAACHSNYGM